MRNLTDTIQNEVNKVILGKADVVRSVLLAILAGGHVLLEDVPGVGKTTMAVAFAKTLGLATGRVQFTSDTLPSDVIGFSVYDKATQTLRYQSGAVMTNLLLADEFNRTSSKTQSALLEAMEERQVTVDGKTYPLQKPFLVIATQNSVGAAGTQFLPYAQVDRFLVRLSLGYPDYAAQMEMLRARQGVNPIDRVRCVLTKDELLHDQDQVRQVVSTDVILDYITRLTMASRTHEAVDVGISPRGALYLDRMAKAHAWMDGRDYVTGGDVRAVFGDVCAHRVLLKEQTDRTADDVLNDLLKTVENPDRRSRGMPKS